MITNVAALPVRQEVCVLHLIQLCGAIFRQARLPLWLRPYSIISTSATTGLIEVRVGPCCDSRARVALR